MHTYTRDELCELLGIHDGQFESVVEKMPFRKGYPLTYKLKTPIDTGERQKAVYVASIHDRGWCLFPTLASAKLWNQERAQWVAA